MHTYPRGPEALVEAQPSPGTEHDLAAGAHARSGLRRRAGRSDPPPNHSGHRSVSTNTAHASAGVPSATAVPSIRAEAVSAKSSVRGSRTVMDSF
ncbi:MAG: hypothetical protein ACR2MB_11450 [Acidimicrobiales bacterium]